MMYWQFEPVPLALLFTLTLLYGLGVGLLRASLAPQQPLPKGKIALFGSGIGLFFLLVASPLHLWAEVFLVSAHMLQLALIIYVVVPLLILGTPVYLLERLLYTPLLRPFALTLTRPAVAFVLFHLVFFSWHIPRVFEAIVFHDLLHSLSYIALVFVATLMWWPVLSPQRLEPLPRLLYLLALFFAHSPVMFIIGNAQAPLYPWYRGLFGLSSLADQNLGSAIMSAINLVALLVPMTVAVKQSFDEAERAYREAEGRKPLEG